MASGIERAIGALAVALAATGAKVERNSDVPETIPANGLIQLTEGHDQCEPLLSPLRYLHEYTIDAAITVTAASEGARDAALDVLLVAVHDVIVANRTLGAVIEFADIGSPVLETYEADGAAKTANLPIVLSFTTAGSPLGPII